MKTLVIHPKDPTTDMLCLVYRDMNCTVIRNVISNSLLKRMINDHDRVILMGHGTSDGLIGFGKFVIDSSLVYLLRDKKELVCVWCHANQFVEKYGLKGLYSGMIISEKEEADYCGVVCDYKHVDKSNDYFADALTACVAKNYSLDVFHDIYYDWNDEDNPVMEYNRQRMFYKKD